MINLPEDLWISKTFNVADFHEFHKDVPSYPDFSSSLSSFQEEGSATRQVEGKN